MSRLITLTFLLFLSGCGSALVTARLDQPRTPGGRMCTGQCGEARRYCQDQCNITARSCQNQMQAQAIHDYDAYAREQYESHQPMELFPRDFERPEKCKPVICLDACENEYRTCFERCGGKVVTESSCTAFCF